MCCDWSLSARLHKRSIASAGWTPPVAGDRASVRSRSTRPSILTPDSLHLHITLSVLKLDACCSAKHELPVLRWRRGGEAAGAGGTRGDTRPSVDEGCWRWRRFGRYGGHVGRGWRRRWPHGHGPVHAVSYLRVVQKLLAWCLLACGVGIPLGGEAAAACRPHRPTILKNS
jgi:hypothetical protein